MLFKRTFELSSILDRMIQNRMIQKEKMKIRLLSYPPGTILAKKLLANAAAEERINNQRFFNPLLFHRTKKRKPARQHKTKGRFLPKSSKKKEIALGFIKCWYFGRMNV